MCVTETSSIQSTPAILLSVPLVTRTAEARQQNKVPYRQLRRQSGTVRVNRSNLSEALSAALLTFVRASFPNYSGNKGCQTL